MNSTMKPAVAIVEDEASLRETLMMALDKEGMQTAVYRDGLEAWTAFQKGLPDLVILDIVMPRMDGLELCRRIRGLDEIIPIIFLSSRDEELDRVLGLELGADDYLCKPFSIRELIARVRVLLRRLDLLRRGSRVEDEDILRADTLEMDLKRYQVRLADVELKLTVTEFEVLKALVQRPGQVKTRERLMEQAYPHDVFVSPRTIDTHIKRIRRKLELLDPGFDCIETVYGLGYRFRDDG